jgi:hypothetical protein
MNGPIGPFADIRPEEVDVWIRRRPWEKAMFKGLCGRGPEARLGLLAG